VGAHHLVQHRLARFACLVDARQHGATSEGRAVRGRGNGSDRRRVGCNSTRNAPFQGGVRLTSSVVRPLG
jgi:hypothetical protein